MSEKTKSLLSAIIREAGKKLVNDFSSDKEILSLEKHDIKLALDRDIELFLKESLSLHFPDVGFIAEELDCFHEERTGHSYWIIDPIDGTSNYAAGIPHFCISVALRKNGETVLGAIYDPLREDFFWAEKGKGAYCNDRLLQMKDISIEKSYCVMGLYKTTDTIDKGIALLKEVAHDYNKIRITGSAALDLAWVAAGRFQIFFEYGIRLWDIAAGELLVKEAGGTVITEPYKHLHTFFIIAGLSVHCERLLKKRDHLFS